MHAGASSRKIDVPLLFWSKRMVERAVVYLAFVFLMVALMMERTVPYAIGP